MIIGPQHGPELPRYLSEMPDKLTLYATDTCFLESWEDVLSVAGSDAQNLLDSLAMLVLKPDAVVTRSIEPAFEWLRSHGFRVVASRRVSFDRHVTRSIWRYSWNVATRDRKDVVDMMLAPGDSLLLLLTGPEDRKAPATRLLSETKGPANPARRKPGQLRYQLGRLNTLLNYLHTADEPADLVREIGVYFAAEERQRLYREALKAGEDSEAKASALAGELEAETPSLSLAKEDVLKRVGELAAVHPEAESAVAVALREELDRIAAGESRDWRTTLSFIDELELPCSNWDRIAIATHLVEMDTPRGELLIQSVSAPGVREHSYA